MPKTRPVLGSITVKKETSGCVCDARDDANRTLSVEYSAALYFFRQVWSNVSFPWDVNGKVFRDTILVCRGGRCAYTHAHSLGRWRDRLVPVSHALASPGNGASVGTRTGPRRTGRRSSSAPIRSLPPSARLSVVVSAALLSPALALLMAIAVEIVIGLLVDAGVPALLALASVAIGWLLLRKVRHRQGGDLIETQGGR